MRRISFYHPSVAIPQAPRAVAKVRASRIAPMPATPFQIEGFHFRDFTVEFHPILKVPAEMRLACQSLAQHPDHSIEMIETLAEGGVLGRGWSIAVMRNKTNEIVGALPVLVTRSLPPHQLLPDGFIKSLVSVVDRFDFTTLLRRLAVPRRVMLGNPFAEQFIPMARRDLDPADYALFVHHTAEYLRHSTHAKIVTLPDLDQNHPLRGHLRQYGFIATEGLSPVALDLRPYAGSYERYALTRPSLPRWNDRLARSGVLIAGPQNAADPDDGVAQLRAYHQFRNQLIYELNLQYPNFVTALDRRLRNLKSTDEFPLLLEEFLNALRQGGYVAANERKPRDAMQRKLERLGLPLKSRDALVNSRLFDSLMRGGFAAAPLLPSYEVVDDFLSLCPELDLLMNPKRNRQGLSFEPLNIETLTQLKKKFGARLKVNICRLVPQVQNASGIARPQRGEIVGFQVVFFDPALKRYVIKKTFLHLDKAQAWDVRFGLEQFAVDDALRLDAEMIEEGNVRPSTKAESGFVAVKVDNHSRYFGVITTLLGPGFARRIERRFGHFNHI